MSEDFSIDAKWSSGGEGPPEEKNTACSLVIKAGDITATQSESEWSRSISDSIYVSAYPLALWFASSWWRLRWESGRSMPSWHPDLNWRMAHELPAAGDGFIWPSLRLASDGKCIEVSGRPTSSRSREPIKYLVNFDSLVSAESFESNVDAFITMVLERMGSFGIVDSELHQIWSEVVAERNDQNATKIRKLEAQVGYDPGEGPEQFLKQLTELMDKIGEGSVEELAAGIAGSTAPEVYSHISDLEKSPGVNCSISIPAVRPMEENKGMPWEIGRNAAQNLRHNMGLNGQNIDNQKLFDLLGISRSQHHFPLPQQPVPIGLAVRSGRSSAMRLYFHKRRTDSQRFEAARFLGEYIFSSVDNKWLTISEASTIRQKIQRAFASEFLCPIESLKETLKGNYSEDSIGDAADKFGVSALMIRSHLANNDLIPWEAVAAFRD